MSFNLNLNGITQQANIANVATPIVIYKVPAGAKVTWPQIAHIIMKLYDTNGNELPVKAQLYFAYKLPADKTWTPLTEVFTYHKFRQMSITDQSDSMKTPTVRMSSNAIASMKMINPEADSITFVQDREIALMLNTDVTYDPTNDNNYLELPDVDVET